MIDMENKAHLVEVCSIFFFHFIFKLLDFFIVVPFLKLFIWMEKEAIMTRTSWVDSHSVIQKMSSGNSLEAEIHLQIFLVCAYKTYF